MHRDKTSHVRITQHFLSPLPAMQPQLTKKKHIYSGSSPGKCITPLLSYQDFAGQKGQVVGRGRRDPKAAPGGAQQGQRGPMVPGHWGTVGSRCSVTPHVPLQQGPLSSVNRSSCWGAGKPSPWPSPHRGFMGRVHFINDLILDFLDPLVTPDVSSNFSLTLFINVYILNKIRQW